ncbi:hypothetical protein [Porcipelethomonas sp.]|uniref:hypothetical protein n=1 Tax=Porcipelethomonas sp. TaxID=2981675 RepID=UPI0030779B6E
MSAAVAAALEMYLGQKNMKLQEELEKFSEQLYQKYVPSNVREFIELTATKKLPNPKVKWVRIVYC